VSFVIRVWQITRRIVSNKSLWISKSIKGNPEAGLSYIVFFSVSFGISILRRHRLPAGHSEVGPETRTLKKSAMLQKDPAAQTRCDAGLNWFNTGSTLPENTP
jgi:hypothetical protein